MDIKMNRIEEMMHIMAGVKMSPATIMGPAPISHIKMAVPCTEPVQKKGNKPMCYECDDYDYKPTAEDKKISYLIDATYAIREDHLAVLHKQFNITEDKPKTIEDLIERVKTGEYQIHSEEYQRDRRWWNPQDFFIWRKPGEKPDQEGFNKAVAAMDEVLEAAKIRIRVLPSAEGLAALDSFKSWSFGQS